MGLQLINDETEKRNLTSLQFLGEKQDYGGGYEWNKKKPNKELRMKWGKFFCW